MDNERRNKISRTTELELTIVCLLILLRKQGLTYHTQTHAYADKHRRIGKERTHNKSYKEKYEQVRQQKQSMHTNGGVKTQCVKRCRQQQQNKKKTHHDEKRHSAAVQRIEQREEEGTRKKTMQKSLASKCTCRYSSNSRAWTMRDVTRVPELRKPWSALFAC